MCRLLMSAITFISLVLIALSSGDAFAGEVRGTVVRLLCPGSRITEVRCPTEPVQTTVDVVAVAVDGRVKRTTVDTNRAGRFRLRLSPGYYVLAARPLDLRMSSRPAEFTVSSGTVTVTLKITDPVN